MPGATHVELRNRAVIAFAILSGARDGAIASFRLKHVNLDARTVFHDARDVRTKARKTFKSVFFPVGPEPGEIFASYVRMLKDELGSRPEDPLFPSTSVALNAAGEFQSQGLTRDMWATAEPIRRIFRDAFTAVGLPAFNPHSFRKTLVRLGQQVCRTPEEWKAWSQNLGHESESTTFVGYGEVPAHRQAEIMAGLGKARGKAVPSDADIEALRAFLKSVDKSAA